MARQDIYEPRAMPQTKMCKDSNIYCSFIRCLPAQALLFRILTTDAKFLKSAVNTFRLLADICSSCLILYRLPTPRDSIRIPLRRISVAGRNTLS